MDPTAMIQEFVEIQKQSGAGDAASGSRQRWQTLKMAISLATAPVARAVPIQSGEIRLRVRDGQQVVELPLGGRPQRVFEMDMQAEHAVGDELVVVLEASPGAPAEAHSALVAAKLPGKPSRYLLELDALSAAEADRRSPAGP